MGGVTESANGFAGRHVRVGEVGNRSDRLERELEATGPCRWLDSGSGGGETIGVVTCRLQPGRFSGSLLDTGAR